MTSCDAPITGFVMVSALLVLPFGVPLVVLGWIAWRRSARWPLVASAVVALAGLVIWWWSRREHPGDPRWLPLLFAPPLAASLAGAAAPTRVLRGAALACALAMALGGLAFGAWLWANAGPCP